MATLEDRDWESAWKEYMQENQIAFIDLTYSDGEVINFKLENGVLTAEYYND